MRKLVQRFDWSIVRKVEERAIMLTALVLCLTSPALAQVPALQQEEPAPSSLSRELSDLHIEPSRLAELERSIHLRNYEAAEKILVEEAERDPESPHSAKLL